MSEPGNEFGDNFRKALKIAADAGISTLMLPQVTSSEGMADVVITISRTDHLTSAAVSLLNIARNLGEISSWDIRSGEARERHYQEASDYAHAKQEKP